MHRCSNQKPVLFFISMCSSTAGISWIKISLKSLFELLRSQRFCCIFVLVKYKRIKT